MALQMMHPIWYGTSVSYYYFTISGMHVVPLTVVANVHAAMRLSVR